MDFSIQGSYCTLTFLSPVAHYEALYTNLQEPSLWKYFYSTPYLSQLHMLEYLQFLDESNSRCTYYVISSSQFPSQPLGFFCLSPNSELQDTIQICSVMFSPKLQKTRIATEAIFLLLKICFQESKVFRVEWMANIGNDGSMRAAERFGFQWKGYQNDLNRLGNRFWYSNILNYEWNGIKQEYERWLEKDNFDEQGKQKNKLETRRGSRKIVRPY